MNVYDLIANNFSKIVAVILTGAFGGYVTWHIYRKQRFITASDKFRNTVLTQLEGLYPTPVKWPSQEMQIIQILKDKFPKLEIAVTEYRCHLGWINRKRFDNVWLQYNKDHYFDYVPIQGKSYAKGEAVYTYDNTKTYQENFKHNVDALLKFAEPR
jgi:hypothetical protein